MRWGLRRSLAAAVASVALLVVSTPPAYAHKVTLAWGQGQYDMLGTTRVNRGNVVGMWQAFLFSYNQVPCSRFDGVFGSATRQGTINFQSYAGLTADGLVGKNTWTKAGEWLERYGDDGWLTSYWWPIYPQRSAIDGLGRFYNIYGGEWSWNTPSEDPYSYTLPRDQRLPSDHSGITFSMSCYPPDG